MKKLIEEEDGCARIFTAAAFNPQFVPDFAAGDENARRVAYFVIGNQRQEARTREFFDVGASVGMAQHAFGGKDNERLAPRAARLAAQQVKILRGCRGLANLHVVFGG